MARVYEAMLLTRHDAPEATQQFLNDYDFSNVIDDSEDESSSTDYDQPTAYQTADVQLNSTYAESYAPVFSDVSSSHTYQSATYQDTEVLDADDYPDNSEVSSSNGNYYSDVKVDISIAQSLAATVNALTEDLSVLEIDQDYYPASVVEARVVTPVRLPVAPIAISEVQVRPISRPMSVENVVVAAVEKRDLVPTEYRNDFIQLSEIVLKTSERSPLKVMIVCGVENEDDADFVSTNLSLALAENTHLRIARFHLPSRKHPARATHPEASFRIKLNKTRIPNLFDITALSGDVTLDQLLVECDVQQMSEMLKARFDYVLIVTDAVNFSDRVAPFAASTDGVVLVAKKENMYGQAMNTARKKLQGANARILGAVLNRSHAPQQLLQVA